MAWRDAFLSRFGPGLLGGLTLGAWLKLLAENRFAVAPSRLPRALSITFQSGQNSIFHLVERLRFGPAVKLVTVPPPSFVLGHWRNGTTHLHNLLTVDNRFAFPNTYQVLFPLTFLTTEKMSSGLIDFFMPKRRPMDNVAWNIKSPQEDEFALCVASRMSPCMGWLFPKRREHYDRYLTFEGVSQPEIERWKDAFVAFLQKLTWMSGRPLILKSPPHTARIKLLLEMFPEARFVHIHRNPYAVFPSSRKTFLVSSEMNGLQPPRTHDLDDSIFRQYRTMYDAFFAERSLIPSGHYHEVAFEQLESNPVGEVARLYESLSLPDFAYVEPSLRRYLDSVAGYEKNAFPALSDELRQRIAEEWQTCFTEWGYDQ
jgi:omega-hydroxy-beta-dihydromenaquinone-9 sulfotransferase